MEEESFPRGGVVPKYEKTKDNKQSAIKERRLFQEIDNEKAKKRDKKDRREKKKVTKKTIQGSVSGQGSLSQPEPLGKLICPGMLVLGCVKEVGNYNIKMALPNGLIGTVPITNISQSYTEIIQNFAAKTAEEQEEEGESVTILPELFTPGELLPCKVMEFDNNGFKKNIKLSLNPADVNDSVTATGIRNGMSLYGSVLSQEDHGYTIDLGVKGIQAFLPSKKAERYIQLQNNDKPLKVGDCFMCGVQMKKDKKESDPNRVITVTVDPETLGKLELKDTVNIPYSSLTTGMKAKVTVSQVGKQGLIVSFLKFKGSIHTSHLPLPLDKYSVDDMLKATILYIHPLSKAVAFSCLPYIVNNTGLARNQFPDINIGMIVPDATVKKVDKRGVYVKLTDKVTGFAGIHNLSDSSEVSLDKDFPKGSTHRCRVLGFAPMESLVDITMKKSILEKQFLSISDIVPGSLLECNVKKLLEKGVSVTISKTISGFIPAIHLADVTLKHPEKKFKEGDKLKCKVLFVDQVRDNVILTHKKSLITSKYPVITDYGQLQPGMLLEGCIYSIKDFGVFVRFFNNVQGLVPKRCLSSEPIRYPEKVFYKGQVVRCRVLHVSPEECKLTLTFVLEGQREFGQKEADAPDDYEIGKFVKCKIANKQETGLDVILRPSKKKAFLPKEHLSDSAEICKALWEVYKQGDVIKEVMYLNKTNVVLVTKRHSMMAASREGTLVKYFDQLKLDMMLPGSVNKIVSYGLFVEFPGGMYCLVPTRYAADVRVPDLANIYKHGQAVVAKVIEIDKEKKRFLASLRMSDCYHGSTDVGINITKNYLEEKQHLMKQLENSELARLAVGEICHGTVTKMNDLGAICCLDNGVNAIALKDNLKGTDVSEGSEVDCVILHVDISDKCVEVSLEPQLVKAVQKRQEKTCEAAQVCQTIKSKVVLVKEDFILVSLKGHAMGQLAYLPSKRHYNDNLERHQFGVGQVNPAVIKRVDSNGNILASLKIHEDKEKTKDEVKISHVPTHSLQIGDIRTASVKRVFADQIYIDIDGSYGRVHATEMLDSIEDGTSPLDNFQVKSEVKVRVIGFREPKSWKFLPVSHPNHKRSFPECSMRPSILSAKKFPADYNCAANNLRQGDKVVAFPFNYTSHCLWTYVRPHIEGKAYALNLTDDKQFFRAPDQKFKPGKGYNGTVLKILSDTSVELSFTENEAPVAESAITKGLIAGKKLDQGLLIQLADRIRGQAALTDLSDQYEDHPTSRYNIGQLVSCYVVSLSEDKKDAVVSLRKSRLNQRICKHTPDIQTVSDLKVDQLIKGFVVKNNEKGVCVRLGHDVNGVISPSDITDKGRVKCTSSLFPVATVVSVKILSIDEENSHISLSVLEEHTGVKLDIPEHLISQPESDISNKEVKRKRSISALSTDHEETVNLENSISVKEGKKKRTLSVSSAEHEEIANSERITSNKDTKRKRSISASSTDHEESVKQKRNKSSKTSNETKSKSKKQSVIKNEKNVPSLNSTATESEDKKLERSEKGKKRKSSENRNKVSVAKKKKDSYIDSGVDATADSDTEIPISDASSMPHLDLSEGFSWSSDFQLPSFSGRQEEMSSDESEDEVVQKPVKKSREELRKEKQEEEKRLFEYERRQLEGEISPETADDFDRLVLQSPDSSLVWLRYMAFHLETSEIDKARAVAERALKTISFREEQEKLNVWVAYLNLENMYGSNESLQKVLTRAVQLNDAVSVYLQMINIYCKSDKIEEAERLYNLLLKKHSMNKDIWVKFGQFYFQNNRLESARKLLQRCLKIIENRLHVETIAKFAQMEFKFGEPERGKTMFENILSTYPKRTDLWSVYIDMVTKLKEFDGTRGLFKRVTSLKLSARKMKFFFKKYLEFEEKHGDETLVAEVKQKALDYVESQGYIDD